MWALSIFSTPGIENVKVELSNKTLKGQTLTKINIIVNSMFGKTLFYKVNIKINYFPDNELATTFTKF